MNYQNVGIDFANSVSGGKSKNFKDAMRQYMNFEMGTNHGGFEKALSQYLAYVKANPPVKLDHDQGTVTDGDTLATEGYTVDLTVVDGVVGIGAIVPVVE